jgi:hypothetical protein
MMRSSMIEPGNIVSIPLDEGMVAVGIVLHVSARIKNGVMIGFYDQLFESVEDIDLKALGSEFIEIPNYTSKQLITSGRWKIIGNSPESLAAANISELRAAYTLYYKDEVVRQLSPAELGDYVEIAGQGGSFIEAKLRKHFAGR